MKNIQYFFLLLGDIRNPGWASWGLEIVCNISAPKLEKNQLMQNKILDPFAENHEAMLY